RCRPVRREARPARVGPPRERLAGPLVQLLPCQAPQSTGPFSVRRLISTWPGKKTNAVGDGTRQREGRDRRVRWLACREAARRKLILTRALQRGGQSSIAWWAAVQKSIRTGKETAACARWIMRII